MAKDYAKSKRKVELTRNQARAVEQTLIEEGDYLHKKNVINSISPKNLFYDKAKEWANTFLKDKNIKM